ncbi:atrial natriuretic peptide receptor 2-like [Ornithodoros turicata]|uniref:atrial natriuretic peptide receptor 2-like n=1 Tax=Ornithodoros turicata TaxID=34597 RepID=UPI0031391B7D
MRLSGALYLLAALLSVLFCCSPAHPYGSKNCFYRREGIKLPTKRILYVKGQRHNIVVEVSRRPTHKIVSHMFKIMVEELLGYEGVELRTFNTFDAKQSLRRIAGCDKLSNCTKEDYIPEVMINLELWMGPGSSLEPWLGTGRVLDCGPLGPIGRSGWFMSMKTVDKFWTENRILLDHWRTFQLEKSVSSLDLLDDPMLHQYTLNPNGATHHCSETECHRGIYMPPICQSQKPRKRSCATLIADYPETTFDLLTEQIKKLKLRVNVAWVGKRLEEYVGNLLRKGDPVVFYNWKPNTLTAFHNVTHVAFPQCEDGILPAYPGAPKCPYEVNHMEKVVWSKLRESAADVYELVQKMTFTQSEYRDLLRLYRDEWDRISNFSTIACLFLEQHEQLIHNFSPSHVGDKPTLYIGGIFPLSGRYNRMNGVVTAAHMAMDAVNRDENVLNDFKLTILEQDGQCQQDVVMKRYIGYVTNATYNNLIGILGPACTDTLEPIVGVAKHYNTVLISYSAEGALSSRRDRYPYFFRTIPENLMHRFVYLKLFEEMRWHRVAALTEEGHKYSEYINLLQDDMHKHGMNFLTNRKFPHEESPHNMSRYLVDLKDRNARIIIGGFYDASARSVMCEAYKQGMTGFQGYQWFLPHWLSSDWYETTEYNKKMNETVPCTTAEMRDAVQGHMILGTQYYADDDAIMQENKTVREWRALYKQLVVNQGKVEASNYGGFAYDAVWVFALALDALFKGNHSHTSTLHEEETFQKLIALINATNFNGVSGNVRFRRSSRLADVIIWQWVNGTHRHVGTYTPGMVDGAGVLHLARTLPSLEYVYWPKGKNQGDGSEEPNTCPLEALRYLMNVSCDVAIIVANLLGFFFFALVMIAGFVFFKRRYEEKVKRTEARIRELGFLTTNNVPSLDGWEMPRDHIVINRKLGEGAFGTVYGGEAFIVDKGWVAVAVKTLKVGAIIEEKLDFLSEAEMMKRFDHKNIVRLLGVCTVGEPVYTIMEFMLYGDLKTYLLARRHLVKEPNRNLSDEASDKCLTAMALDVARGLSYLADLKYVHRDLACRNCLVNAGRTVKIGDFGMCRPMYDSDYYRFNKRGMLPVRWMAPESLNDGIFTTMSDVWSYGVLLYEIITFASFPYQGLSNNQVLEYVKNYNTLPVPSGCKPELDALLLRCWARSAQQRPSACEIVEILATNSTLISPCLDLPVASVQVEGTDSLEFAAIGDRNRLHSISSLGRKADSASNAANAVDATSTRVPLVPHGSSPPSLPRSQYVTLRQSARIRGSTDGGMQCTGLGQTITAV